MTGLPDYLEGAVDLHVHSAPDVDRGASTISNSPRRRDAGVGAILIKVASKFDC